MQMCFSLPLVLIFTVLFCSFYMRFYFFSYFIRFKRKIFLMVTCSFFLQNFLLYSIYYFCCTFLFSRLPETRIDQSTIEHLGNDRQAQCHEVVGLFLAACTVMVHYKRSSAIHMDPSILSSRKNVVRSYRIRKACQRAVSTPKTCRNENTCLETRERIGPCNCGAIFFLLERWR